MKDEDVGGGWYSEDVAALLVMFSIEDYDLPLMPFSTNRPNKWDTGTKYDPSQKYRANSGIPRFVPGVELHGDIEYLWKIKLGPDNFKYKIKYGTDIPDSFAKVEW
jgi:hypothetical protein